jgi:REP element-mobilizing transposase RayT
MQCEYRNQADTLCFVVMPDHFHWLMQLSGHEELSSIIRKVKTITARQMGISIWQKGFHDRAIRKDEDIKAIARYIIANPVRAGIVKSVKHYPHWDACWI